MIWYRKSENKAIFRFGVGVKFLHSGENFGLKASLSNISQMKTPNKNEDWAVDKIEKRLSE
jgi:hypothetical protein